LTWQLGAFAILFLALAGGFGWYERTRPDARIVALVATLAAVAALGRIAFAALPNVKPTTDIVLISGYALGPAPGFVVGALAGLSSNFFLGQGPWTPWQMVAWGAAGVIGAGLAALTGRRMPRWPLAIACALVGFGFTVVQDTGDWVSYSDHSLSQLGVYVGKGIGFDAVHAFGCLAFALAFGPALARSIGRFATRLQVTWRAPDGVIVPVAAALALGAWLAAQPAVSGTAPAAAATTQTAYLLSAQNSDGGLGGAPGQPSSGTFSGWAALGLAANAVNPQRVIRDGHSVIDYLRLSAGSGSDPGSLERTILAVRAAGLPVTSFGGRDLVAALEREIRPNGSVSDQTNLTAFAILALRAAGVPPSARTLGWLVRQEDHDGGFNFATAPGTSDVDDTGAALEALAGAPAALAARARAAGAAFIEAQQNRDGGFAAAAGGDSNAQSTAWAVQGLLAAGADPASLHRRGARSPLQYLGSLLAADGHIRYSHASDQTPVWVTAEAMMALARKPLPLAPVALPAQAPAPSPAQTSELKLATYAGIVAAVVFAPLGLG
jgi:energy-coupling factor transport system substrate-specific component